MRHADCAELHRWANTLPSFSYPFDVQAIPQDGLYLFFEKGEKSHGADRIVRVGIHTGERQLRSRLQQHLVNENKDRSIFRKNIGRALLNKTDDPFLPDWNLDLTTRAAKDRHAGRIDAARQQEIEHEVSGYMRANLRFVALRTDLGAKRKELEAKLISTLSLCQECRPSWQWLGQHSPIADIRESGLWQVQGLYGEPLSAQDFVYLQDI